MSDAAHPNPAPADRPARPRTSPGRRRSRENARVHGLTAALPDGEAEATLMQEFADRWTRQLGADTDAEEALIRSSAIAYARVERCRKAEQASLRTGARDAVERWERKKRHAVRRTAQNLAKDPYNTVADLEASSFGCEWLMRHWLRLDAKLDQAIPWDADDQTIAMHLLGFFPRSPGPDADPTIRGFYHLVRVCSGYPSDPLPGQPVHPVPARADLRRLILDEFDRLEALRNELWESQDGPEAESVAQLGLIDTSKDGQLRQRYRREAFSEMLRGINQVMRLRVERSKDQDRQWHQAHPHVSRRRTSGFPTTNAGLSPVPPSPAPPASKPARRPEPPRAPDHRNEPPQGVPEPSSDRLNPQSGNEMRRDVSGGTSPNVQRTQPRFTAPPMLRTASPPPAEAPLDAPRRT